MKPVNRSERSHTFLRFLLFFIVTVALIVTVVFFSVEVTIKENEQLRSQMLEIQKEKKLSNSFKLAMRQAMDELNNFDPEKGVAQATSRQVDMKLTQMNEILKKIPNGENSIYDLIIQNIAALSKEKIVNSKK